MGTPCLRMHCANLSAAAFWLADATGGCVLAGIRYLHACMADVNAGEGFLARLTGIWIPESASGSGKLGTPWSRMQVANLTPTAWSLDAAACDAPEEPHAASTSAQPQPAIATAQTPALSEASNRWPCRRIPGVSVVADLMALTTTLV